jgi:hypothetical protein
VLTAQAAKIFSSRQRLLLRCSAKLKAAGLVKKYPTAAGTSSYNIHTIDYRARADRYTNTIRNCHTHWSLVQDS